MVLTNVMVDAINETKTSEENNPKTSPKHIFNNLRHKHKHHYRIYFYFINNVAYHVFK